MDILYTVVEKFSFSFIIPHFPLYLENDTYSIYIYIFYKFLVKHNRVKIVGEKI